MFVEHLVRPNNARNLLIPFMLLTTFSTGLAASAVDVNGALSVQGNQIVNKDGHPAMLAGPSLFWSNTGWGGDRYYEASTVEYLHKDWNASLVRAAMGVDENGGYLAHPGRNTERVETIVDAAIAQGMYVIIDWHSHQAEKNPAAAISFFEKMATKYGGKPNVIYEVYNEPLNTADWSSTIKPYAEAVVAKIRAIDPDNLIIVGTQTWSQDVDKAAEDPILGVKNLAYTLHFYAGSHKSALRNKAKYALDKGIALFVTEWGSVNANGDGVIDEVETNLWINFMRDNHLSHCNWAFNDKREGASALKNGTSPNGKWTDANLTTSGLMVKKVVQSWGSPQ